MWKKRKKSGKKKSAKRDRKKITFKYLICIIYSTTKENLKKKISIAKKSRKNRQKNLFCYRKISY